MKLPALPGWLRNPSRSRRRREEDLDEEIAAHLRMAQAERIARGESPAEAETNARREFGNLPLVKQITRENWGGLWLERLVQDLRLGLRMLRRNPSFSILAIFCLTLGIGANAAVYSWIEGILLRPYALVAGQDRMVVLVGKIHGEPGHDALSYPDFLDLRRNSRLFETFAVDKITGTTLANGDRAERVTGQIVSANYFDAIGVRPLLGRGFEPAEESGRNAHPVVVIGYKMWQDRFHRDPGILGKTQILNGVPHTIVGVAPEEFHGTFVGYLMQFWVPASMQETFDPGGYKLEDRGARWVEGFATMKPGVTIAQAQAEVSAVANRLEAQYPDIDKGREIELSPLWKSPFNGAGRLHTTLQIAAVVAFFVLLIACANVSNLLLVRSFARRQEMTIRLAVGSGRGRLVRQLAAEGLIVSALAAGGGLLVAYGGRNLLVRVLPSRGVALYLPASIDWRVLAISAAACLVSTLLFGIVPAIPASQIDLASSIKSETGGVVGGSSRSRVRSGIVLLQVSLSFVLLVAAGLLVRSLQAMRSASPGFSTSDVVIAGLDLGSAGYDAARRRNFQSELLDRVRALDGVRSAAFARVAPFSYSTFGSSPIVIQGYSPARDEQPAPDYDEISPDFFATLRIPILAGRDFTRTDDESAPPVAIVNEAMAAKYWPRSNPLGGIFQLKGRTLHVVGVAKMANYESLLEIPRPFFYVPLRQFPEGVVVLHVRSDLPFGAMASTLIRQIHALDPGLAPSRVATMREQVDIKSEAQRVALTLVGVFGGLALLLSAIGLYGVMSCAVSQGQRELGLRMALGAAASDLLRFVIRHGAVLTAGGVFLGTVVALVSTRLLGTLLYRVSPRDPLVFGSAFVVMGVCSLVACLLPAWRAARTDPVRALRA